MPFLYPDSLLDQAGKIAQEVSQEQRVLVSQEILKEFIRKSSKTESDFTVLLAHYYFEGAEVSNTQYPESEMGEVEFTPSMIPENIDLALFGHVHLHQAKEARGVPVIFAGALERIDWGERKSEKGFLVVDPASMKWRFHPLPTRDMLEIRVKVEIGDKDPTSTIIDEIPSDLKEKMVRLIVELPSGMRPLIHEDKIAEKLAPSFDYKVAWPPSSSELSRVSDVSKGLPNMYELLDSFIEESFGKHPRKQALIREGRSILKEALEE
jgi:DNA repair exonuclease SbcCD nuclease subunit